MDGILGKETGCSQSTGLKWLWIKPTVIAGSRYARNRKGTIAECGQILPDRGGGKILQGSTAIANCDNRHLMENVTFRKTFLELK